MLVYTFLRYTKTIFKNKAAFKPPNRKPKIRRRLVKKQIDLAFKRLIKASLSKYKNDTNE